MVNLYLTREIKANKGRPSKLSPQDKRSIVRSITSLRQKEGSFTSKRVQVESGVSHVSGRTIRNCLNEDGYIGICKREKKVFSMPKI